MSSADLGKSFTFPHEFLSLANPGQPKILSTKLRTVASGWTFCQSSNRQQRAWE